MSTRETMTTPTTPEIMAAVSEHEARVEGAGWCLALRVDAGLSVGDELPASRRWDDGDVTDEMLPGTSALRIGFVARADLVARALEHARGYHGAQIALIAGKIVDDGEDPGEVLLREPEVLAIWDR